MGNINIGGFTSGGAQSVNVSLSGSTLTVNVDGHSDSVNISSAIQNSEFSIRFTTSVGAGSKYNVVGQIKSINSTEYDSYQWYVDETSPITLPYGTSQVYISQLVSGTSLSYGTLESSKMPYTYSDITSISPLLSISGSGSGTIRIIGVFDRVSSLSSSDLLGAYGPSSKTYVEFHMRNGTISSMDTNCRSSGTGYLLIRMIESITLL